MPIEAIIPRPKSEDEHVSEPEEYVRTLQEKLTRAHEIARKHIKQNADYQKKYYDTKASTRFFKEGQVNK